MSIINTNISSLTGLNNLRLTNLGLRTSLERLSSGLRINRAADDPSGLAIAIVRDDLLDQARADVPSIFDYKLTAKNDSMFNTPPTYAWYLAGLVFEWLKEQGGLEAMEARNKEKADFLYDYLDQSSFYGNQVDVSCRSRMNIPFQLKNAELDKQFLTESEAAGLLALKGHRIVGGMRASLYNAMPLAGVKALVSFMDGFAKRHG